MIHDKIKFRLKIFLFNFHKIRNIFDMLVFQNLIYITYDLYYQID